MIKAAISFTQTFLLFHENEGQRADLGFHIGTRSLPGSGQVEGSESEIGGRQGGREGVEEPESVEKQRNT